MIRLLILQGYLLNIALISCGYWVSLVICMVLGLLLDSLFLGFLYFSSVGHTEKLILF
jgi:hypothetical protein